MKCAHCGATQPRERLMLLASDCHGGKKWFCREWQECEKRA
jgi:hypothetical protein